MKVSTRLFGEIDIQEDKIICLQDGIVGFPDLKKFTLIYDEEKGKKTSIKWLQSMDEPGFAMPVMNPLDIDPFYRPTIDEETIKSLGTLTSQNTFILVTVTVPSDIKQISVNLKAPFIINMETLKGEQRIVEDDYEIKYKIYDLIKSDQKEGE